MSELTPEEKQKIYEDEKVRHEARKKLQKKKTSPITWGCLIIIVIVIVTALIGSLIKSPEKPTVVQKQTSSKVSPREQLLKKELSYLNDIAEVEWFEVDDNNVYIGFNARTDDLSLIVRGAAVKENKAINFGVHAWAVSSSQKGWRPGDGPYLYEATARHGKIEN